MRCSFGPSAATALCLAVVALLLSTVGHASDGNTEALRDPTIEILTDEEFARLHDSKGLIITVTGDGTLFVRDTEVRPEQLGQRLKMIAVGPEQQVFVRADKRVKYGFVSRVVSIIMWEGFKKVTLIVTEH